MGSSRSTVRKFGRRVTIVHTLMEPAWPCFQEAGIVVLMSRPERGSPVNVGSIPHVCQSHLAGLSQYGVILRQ